MFVVTIYMNTSNEITNISKYNKKELINFSYGYIMKNDQFIKNSNRDYDISIKTILYDTMDIIYVKYDIILIKESGIETIKSDKEIALLLSLGGNY